MKATTVEAQGEGRFLVRGPLRFHSVPGLWRDTRGLFSGTPRVTLDFSAVTEVDSAGLALLVEWLREARRAGGEIHFQGMPRQMQAIARVSGLEGLLP